MKKAIQSIRLTNQNFLNCNLFYALFLLFAFLYIIYILYIIIINKKDYLGRLVSNFNITNLYSSNNTYNSSRTSINNYIQDDDNFSVIGLIEINAIGINYPILSKINDDLLKIAPCRFYGPMPNEVGNLCIAGHNYNNYKFFSRLKKLNNGDIINIYDLSGTKIEYSVYNSYETNYNDLSCISQDTSGSKEVTLITCNNIKNKRRVIKARQKTQP